jgi:hypothetical protein
MLEKGSDRVTLHDVDHGALSSLVEYAYTGQLTITEDNVQCLLPAASLLQISVIREACCSFLLRQLHPTNCLGIHNFADTHSCAELQVTSHKYALVNFKEVSLTEEFLSLSFEQIIGLLTNNQLNVAYEATVYIAATRWTKHDTSHRQVYFPTLLSHVRLPLLARDFLLTHVLEEDLVQRSLETKDLLIEAMRFHLCPEGREEILVQPSGQYLGLHLLHK